MEPDEIFQRLPDLLFTSFRKRLILGEVPAETVHRILEPLLSNFLELMLQLPADLQVDFENILRIYSDVADRFGLRIKPPILEALRSFTEYRQSSRAHGSRGKNGSDPGLDMAAEAQKELVISKSPILTEGQGFFKADSGRPVYLEFSYSEVDNLAAFEFKPAKFEIEIFIRGMYTVSLGPLEPKKSVAANELLRILEEPISLADIKIFEKSK